MIRALASLAAMSAATLAAPALADEPVTDRPTMEPGSSWDYADRVASIACKHWESAGVENGLRLSQCDGYKSYTSVASDELVRVVDKNGNTVVQFAPSAVTISFPLQVGKKWQGKYSGYTADDGAQWNGDATCEVKAYEKIKVAAGEFDAYRIDCSDAWQAGPAQGVSASTSWYAPKAGVTVKSVHPTAPKWDLELTGYSMK